MERGDPVLERAILARMWRAIAVIALLDVLLFILYVSGFKIG